jgi:hypothetical protein
LNFIIISFHFFIIISFQDLNKVKRIRLDSAPTSGIDHENVNLTLCGYLHTVHSPSVRQQFLNMRNNNQLMASTNSLKLKKNSLSFTDKDHQQNRDTNGQEYNKKGLIDGSLFNPPNDKESKVNFLFFSSQF